MAPDPLGSLLTLALLFVLGALLRAAVAASQRIDENRFDGVDAARIQRLQAFAKSSQNRFGDADIAFGLLMAGACASALFWPGEPLGRWLGGFMRSDALRRLLTGVGIVVPTAVLFVVLAGLLPAHLAATAPESTLRRTFAPARFVLTLLRPLTALAHALSAIALKPFGAMPSADVERVTEQEIRMMVDIGEEKGEIEADEKQMIENIFEFNNLTAEECMVHRKDFFCVDIEDEPDEILTIIRDSGLSRFPVYEEDVDNIIGILTTRDYLLNGCAEREKPLRELIRPAYFVPETLRADILFSEMQRRKQHMAIVVDEYGGTSGLVTLEDLLEEIVGNIYDEFDPQVHEEIIFIGEDRWRVRGSVDLDTLSEAIDADLDAGDDVDTLGGLVFSELTEIPSDGEHPMIVRGDMRITVEKIMDRRVEWAVVEKLAPQKPTGDAQPAK